MAFPSHTEAQGVWTSSLIVMGKVIGYKTKVKSSAGIPGTEIAACSPALTLSQRKEGSGYRQSRSRAHIPTLQQANTQACCEQEQNETFLPKKFKDNLVGEVPKLPSLPSSHRASLQ